MSWGTPSCRTTQWQPYLQHTHYEKKFFFTLILRHSDPWSNLEPDLPDLLVSYSSRLSDALSLWLTLCHGCLRNGLPQATIHQLQQMRQYQAWWWLVIFYLSAPSDVCIFVHTLLVRWWGLENPQLQLWLLFLIGLGTRFPEVGYMVWSESFQISRSLFPVWIVRLALLFPE